MIVAVKRPLENLAFDLRALSVFAAAADAGSMTLGARRLGMTQPAVTKIVKRLEEDMGAPLLERRVRPFIPTRAGQQFLDGARNLLAQAEHLQASVRDAGDATLPAVRIGLIDSFAATAGPGLIRAMRGYARNMTVWSGISPNLGDDLIRRRLDFIISTDPMESLGGVERHTIMQEPFLLVLPRRMAENIPAPDLDNLARNHPFVRYSVRSMIGASIEDHLAREGINIGENLQFDGTEAVFAMVSAGLGWAITTPLCLIHGFAHMPTLNALPLPGRSLSRTLYLVAREGEFGNLLVRMTRDARTIAQGLIDNRVSSLAPWAVGEMSIG